MPTHIPHNLHPGDRVKLSPHAIANSINSTAPNRETMQGTILRLRLMDDYPIVRWDHQRPTSQGASYSPAFITRLEP